jgi:hypothetical protein
MHPRSATHRWTATAFAAALAVSGLAACGSSGSSASKSKSDTTSATTEAAGATSAHTACLAWSEVDEAAGKGPGGPDGPPSPAAIKAFASTLKPMIARVAAAAPAEVAGPVKTVKGIVDDASNGKDPQKLDPSNPALGKPVQQIEKWVYDSCGFNQLDVMGKDYSYDGIATRVPHGTTSVKFENMANDEVHELSLMVVKPGAGVTGKEIADALKADPNAAQQKYQDKVDFVTNTQANPGETTYTTANLNVGDYIAVCFIGPDGQPHAGKGMVTSFTVD